MRKAHGWALGGLIATLALAAGWTGTARSQLPPPPPGALDEEIARQTKVDREDVRKVLQDLGPKLSRQLSAGRTVVLPGLGTFRAVRIPEHRDLVDGRPATIPEQNYVEFLPDAAVVRAAASPQAQPAVTVPPFEYNTLRDQTPGQKVPSGRTPSTRIR
jgi:nucleoid DNA-binding protein